jgi:hypothetical protein
MSPVETWGKRRNSSRSRPWVVFSYSRYSGKRKDVADEILALSSAPLYDLAKWIEIRDQTMYKIGLLEYAFEYTYLTLGPHEPCQVASRGMPDAELFLLFANR